MPNAAAVAGAAAVVVLLVSAGIRFAPATVPGGAGPTAVPSPSETPRATPTPTDRSYREVGFIGLPPPGAMPSGPGAADLVVTFWLTRNSGAGYRGGAMLYGDGRLIWNEYFPTAESGSTGWLEQRLTSEGIDLVRGLGVQTSEPDVPRRLDAALRDAGLEQDGRRNLFLLEYHIDLDGDRPGTTQLGIWFEPILPDGTITCSSCG